MPDVTRNITVIDSKMNFWEVLSCCELSVSKSLNKIFLFVLFLHLKRRHYYKHPKYILSVLIRPFQSSVAFHIETSHIDLYCK